MPLACQNIRASDWRCRFFLVGSLSPPCFAARSSGKRSLLFKIAQQLLSDRSVLLKAEDEALHEFMKPDPAGFEMQAFNVYRMLGVYTYESHHTPAIAR